MKCVFYIFVLVFLLAGAHGQNFNIVVTPGDPFVNVSSNGTVSGLSIDVWDGVVDILAHNFSRVVTFNYIPVQNVPQATNALLTGQAGTLEYDSELSNICY